MIITVEGLEYKCDWEQYGCTYAIPLIYIRELVKKHWWSRQKVQGWVKWSKDGYMKAITTASYHFAVRMSPVEATRWFTECITQQITYNREWLEWLVEGGKHE